MTKLKDYGWFDNVPENLKTKTQLKEMRLKPTGEAKGYVYSKRHKETYYLYDVAETVKMRELTEAQKEGAQRALITRETCKGCNTRYLGMTFGKDSRCEACRIKADQAQTVEWAQVLLDSPDDWVVLDTETTGLKSPEIIEIAVVSGRGDVLVNTQVKPVREIDWRATEVHNIIKDDLVDAPDWSEVYPQVLEAVRGKKVYMYGAEFDLSAVQFSCYFSLNQNLTPKQSLKGMKGYGCVKLAYARYYGLWNDYHESYRWQPLPYGDHTAVGDCFAVLDLIRNIAKRKAASVFNINGNEDKWVSTFIIENVIQNDAGIPTVVELAYAYVYEDEVRVEFSKVHRKIEYFENGEAFRAWLTEAYPTAHLTLKDDRASREMRLKLLELEEEAHADVQY